MKNEFLTGMAALLLTFGLVLAGCPQDLPDDGDVIDVAELEAELTALTPNTAANPHTFKLPAINPVDVGYVGSDWEEVSTAVQNAQRYVILDLSDCTFGNNTVSSWTGGHISDNEYIKGIILPSGVTSIGVRAFSGCTALTSVTIPAGVTSIGDGAFSGCEALTSVTIPASVTSIEGSVFRDCTALTSVTIPASVTSIGDSAFSGCTALTGVTIPAKVTSIGWGAFSGCTALTSVTIPAGVTSIGYNAFYGCRALTSVTFAEGSNIVGSGFGNYAFPEGADGFGGNALKTVYNAATTKAGTYTRSAGGSTWTKQGA